ncbi:OB-fold-containig protein [Algibacillus agarilyticus]|uniref:OB-fold-containig protein n=1 Tax=Algibacillus agarilyticus TaxID=2234133 RepID=UPI000DD061CB|nr:OB-fold-containig protein [Algibacillus agarilyticus]
MDLFLTEVFSFPNIIFSLPLVVIFFFWLVALLGFVDIEIADIEPEIENDNQTETSWLQKLGLDGAPLMVVLTFLDAYGLGLSYVARKFMMPLADELITSAVLGSLIALFAVVVAIPLTAISIKPLRRFFYTHEAVSKSDITGQICVVTTTKVTNKFGQAVLDDGSMVLSVRADEPNNISKGDRIALISYDKNNDHFWVVTEYELLNQN